VRVDRRIPLRSVDLEPDGGVGVVFDAPAMRERGHDRQAPASAALTRRRRQPRGIKAGTAVGHLDAHRLTAGPYGHADHNARLTAVANRVGDQLADEQLRVAQALLADQMQRAVEAVSALRAADGASVRSGRSSRSRASSSAMAKWTRESADRHHGPTTPPGAALRGPSVTAHVPGAGGGRWPRARR
jgi:hypothetical protein